MWSAEPRGRKSGLARLDLTSSRVCHDRTVAWIDTVAPESASGLLARLYAAAVRRAGRVFNVIRIQSQRPRVLRASTQLYLEVMCSEESALTRAQREMIATAVSRANDCHY